ncbi:hypothetical protein BDV95DRAFT_269442 [Massariosphaeria phaeospora]|uniref:Uncharacterized protein n=1 Tax=Massariosphaeria phaeospora TaxID=100035 RepID=A0A7C8M1B0_9PLEO|nr:hypothetical protein BDV95DRAFT_269442 [Massariosphaeria phaeospora]
MFASRTRENGCRKRFDVEASACATIGFALPPRRRLFTMMESRTHLLSTCTVIQVGDPEECAASLAYIVISFGCVAVCVPAESELQQPGTTSTNRSVYHVSFPIPSQHLMVYACAKPTSLPSTQRVYSCLPKISLANIDNSSWQIDGGLS